MFCLLRLTTFHFSFESSHSKMGDKVIEEGSERERVFMKGKQIRAGLLRNLVLLKHPNAVIFSFLYIFMLLFVTADTICRGIKCLHCELGEH